MKPKSTHLHFLLLAGSSLLALSSASAQINGDWNVNAAGNWSSPGNWLGSPDPVPGGAGSIINLTNDISAALSVTIDTTSRTVGTLNIGDSNNSHRFTLNSSGGASLIFNNNGSGASIVENGSLSGTNRDTISVGIALADNLEINTGGALVLSGTIIESGGARSITKTGNGTLFLTGNNSFSGGVKLNAGQINIGNDNVLGTGNFTINGGRVDLAGAGAGETHTTTNNNVWNASWAMGRGTTGTGTWNNNGDVLLGANVIVSSANSFTNLSLGGVISDGGNGHSLAINTNTVTLSGANTYSGGTSFTGVLNIKHAQALGTGALTITGNTRTINNTSGSAITLSNNNALNLNNNLTFTGASDLNFGTGAVTLQGGNRTVQVTAGTLTFGGAVGQDVAGRQLTVQGNGTLVLAGNNTYTGTTDVISPCTLALVGGSQTSPIAVAAGASLGFTPGMPSVSSSSVNLTTGTVKIIGPVDNASDYRLITAASGITGTLALHTPVPGYKLEFRNSGNELWLAFTGSSSPFETWATGGETFDGDANGDGVDDGLAWFLGAMTPADNALGKLPVPTKIGSFLTLDFLRVNPYSPANLYVQFGNDLSGWTEVEIPSATATITLPGDDVEVEVTAGSPDAVKVKIPTSYQSASGALFARLRATEN